MSSNKYQNVWAKMRTSGKLYKFLRKEDYFGKGEDGYQIIGKDSVLNREQYNRSFIEINEDHMLALMYRAYQKVHYAGYNIGDMATHPAIKEGADFIKEFLGM